MNPLENIQHSTSNIQIPSALSVECCGLNVLLWFRGSMRESDQGILSSRERAGMRGKRLHACPHEQQFKCSLTIHSPRLFNDCEPVDPRPVNFLRRATGPDYFHSINRSRVAQAKSHW